MEGTANQNDIEPMIIAFLNFKPSLLYAFDEKAVEKPFPTPRTWQYASEIYMKTSNPMSIARVVGAGASTEFDAFVRLRSKIPDPKRLLQNPDEAQLPQELSLMYVLFGTLVEYVSKDLKKTENFLKLVKKIPEDFIEIAIMSLKMLIGNRQAKNYIIKAPTWKELAYTYGEYVL